MTSSIRWTSQDLQSLPDDGKRYEIIGGELYMSKQPHWNHQKVAFRLANFLEAWNLETQAGEVGFTPGLVFAEDDIVSWQKRQIDVYRRDDNTQELRSGISLHEGDTLTSPLLEGFGRTISEIFKGVNAI